MVEGQAESERSSVGRSRPTLSGGIFVVTKTSSRATPLSRDRPAHLLFVVVPRGGVDVPVARLERPADGVAGCVAAQLPRAEPDEGDLAAPGEARTHVVR